RHVHRAVPGPDAGLEWRAQVDGVECERLARRGTFDHRHGKFHSVAAAHQRRQCRVLIPVQPFAAAGIPSLWLREAASARTMWASLVALAGIAIIVSGAGNVGDIRGIALALLMVISISAMTVVIRRHRETPMVASAAVSNLLGSLVCIPFAHEI